jgi:hypothetical protein
MRAEDANRIIPTPRELLIAYMHKFLERRGGKREIHRSRTVISSSTLSEVKSKKNLAIEWKSSPPLKQPAFFAQLAMEINPFERKAH